MQGVKSNESLRSQKVHIRYVRITPTELYNFLRPQKVRPAQMRRSKQRSWSFGTRKMGTVMCQQSPRNTQTQWKASGCTKCIMPYGSIVTAGTFFRRMHHTLQLGKEKPRSACHKASFTCFTCFTQFQVRECSIRHGSIRLWYVHYHGTFDTSVHGM